MTSEDVTPFVCEDVTPFVCPLSKRLTGLGLVSAYHHSHNEPHGRETRPTYYFHWKKDRPYHIDYCFVPQAWADKIVRVEIGSYEDWKEYSDHRPLLVEISADVV
jgi:endonuclease/exonuclease/phosphatase family metal-dependent hydrolase